MTHRPGQLHLNAFLMSTGHHEASWRLPESDPSFLSTNIAYLQRLGTDLFAKPAEPTPAKAVEKPLATTPLSQINAGGNP